MGLAVYNSIILDIRFPACCYKKLLSPAVVPYQDPHASVGVASLGLQDLMEAMPVRSVTAVKAFVFCSAKIQLLRIWRESWSDELNFLLSRFRRFRRRHFFNFHRFFPVSPSFFSAFLSCSDPPSLLPPTQPPSQATTTTHTPLPSIPDTSFP